jgi:hypothetical protein
MSKKRKPKYKYVSLNYFQLITGDRYETGKIFEEPMAKGEYTVLTPETLQQLREQGQQKYALYKSMIRSMMKLTRAEFARDLRKNQKMSWRAIAARCWTEWQGTWAPPTNQLAGMAICEIASEILDEIVD